MGIYFSGSLLIFPISSIDAFSSSYLRVIYFFVMQPSSSGSGVSVLSLFTPAPLYLGFKVMSLLYLSLHFSIVISAWILGYSLELTMAAIYMALSSR